MTGLAGGPREERPYVGRIAPRSAAQDLGTGAVRISYTGAERKESRKGRREREAERRRKKGVVLAVGCG